MLGGFRTYYFCISIIYMLDIMSIGRVSLEWHDAVYGYSPSTKIYEVTWTLLIPHTEGALCIELWAWF